MANTKQSTKRARQELKRQATNRRSLSLTKTAVKVFADSALSADKTKKKADLKGLYMTAIKSLSKAASKGTIPKARASRKISRLTHLLNKNA